MLHMLYLPDPETEQYVLGLMGDELARCCHEAWICISGTPDRYPFQMHLGRLPEELVVRCLSDLAHVSFSSRFEPTNFLEMLRSTFGTAAPRDTPERESGFIILLRWLHSGSNPCSSTEVGHSSVAQKTRP
jgi:hypothetical protein